jgi:adenylate cyclase
MASREFAEASGLDWWRRMGRVVLRGRARPVDLFEPAPDFPRADAALLAEACEAALAGERAKALRLAQDVADRHPDDSALRNLVRRMQNMDEGGTYVLG